MLCSKCSAPVRPVVAIDIDGTLGDYHGYFLKFAGNYLGRWWARGEPYRGQCGFREWFCRAYEVDEATWRDVKLAYRQGGMKRSMPLFYEAADVCRWVRKHAELWLTTTRPYQRLDNVDPDTRFWLERHDIAYDGLLYDEEKYRVLAERVDPQRVAAVVDDQPDQYNEAAIVYGWRVPILRQTSWNSAVAVGAPRTMKEVQGAIDERLKEWEKSHE